MIEILVLKERLRSFYGKYSIYLISLVKFFLGMTVFYLINSNIGFMSRLNHPLIPVVMGLVASFLPYGVTAFFAGCFTILHASQVSLEVAIILAVFLIAVFLLYYGFRPGDGYLLLLTPMLFLFKIPYVVPLIVGLSGSIVSVIPVSCGVCIYYMIMYLKQNAGILTGSSVAELAERFILVSKSIFGNELMLVMIGAFAAAVIVVYLIKNLSIDYSWTIAIIAGVITQLIVIFIGDFNYDLPVAIPSMILGIVVSVILALIYQFFVFAVDYSRTEYLQFEDDEYYYYVKAVPKYAVSAPDVKVHRIYSRKSARPDRNVTKRE